MSARFRFVWFYGISTIIGYLMPNLLFIYLYISIKYIWFGWVGFYGISTIVGYLIPNPLYTYILNVYDLVGLGLWHINHCRLFNAKSFFIHVYKIYNIWFGWVLRHFNHCWLFNAKSSIYIYIENIWFGLVGFYGKSSIVGYLMPNHIYTYFLNIYNLVW